MPLPIILGIGAAVAGVAGVGSGIHGAIKMKEANDTIQEAQNRHERNMNYLEKEETSTSKSMDKLGKLELEILHSFKNFSDIFEQIKNRPHFKEYSKNGIVLPRYDGESLQKVSIGAGVLLGGLGGAAAGTAGGIAAAGATSAAVIAVGTASTGTAIASLSGVAATNATLAAIGGGAIAAGGGGMALGSAILGATTLGIGLLVGGIIFNVTGEKLSDKADEAWDQMKKAEKKIDKICTYLEELKRTANSYLTTMVSVNTMYEKHLAQMQDFVVERSHKDWNKFTNEEQLITENTVLLVGLLYNMCKVELVLKNKNEEDMNIINKDAVAKSINNAGIIMNEIEHKESLL